MKERTLKYLKLELNKSDEIAEQMYEKLFTHEDILEEFIYWLENRKFKESNFIIVEGLSAEDIFDETHLLPIGAFNYLIYLRKEPFKALENLRRGLPRK